MNKRFGFTLAEVLITLGIIGVVAAMTIPTLMSNTNSQKFRSQFKKSVSTLNQAVLMSVAQNELDFAGATALATTAVKTDSETSSIASILNGSLTGYTWGSYDSTTGYTEMKGTEAANVITLADGAAVWFHAPVATGCTLPTGATPQDAASWANGASCYGYIDVNGSSLPNTLTACSSGAGDTCVVNKGDVKDVFKFYYYDATIVPDYPGKYVLTTQK